MSITPRQCRSHSIQTQLASCANGREPVLASSFHALQSTPAVVLQSQHFARDTGSRRAWCLSLADVRGLRTRLLQPLPLLLATRPASYAQPNLAALRPSICSYSQPHTYSPPSYFSHFVHTSQGDHGGGDGEPQGDGHAEAHHAHVGHPAPAAGAEHDRGPAQRGAGVRPCTLFVS